MARPTATRQAVDPETEGRTERYDRRSLTYANTFDTRWQSRAIRTIEWLTGKPEILRRVRRFEKAGAPRGQAFWRGALDVMGIPVLTPDSQLAQIPATGPVVVVANHPHGLVDGMILAELIGRARKDYRILTRAVLTGIDETASSFMIPVPFPHDPGAQAKFVAMRRAAMDHLRAGGVVALFPAGVVASADSMFGPPREAEWSVFTAQLIRRSGATVVPVRFAGQNSRWYQIANRLSATLRQGLLLHEIVHALDQPQAPVIGPPVTRAQMTRLDSDPRGFMAWLRAHVLSLDGGASPVAAPQRVGTGSSPR